MIAPTRAIAPTGAARHVHARVRSASSQLHDRPQESRAVRAWAHQDLDLTRFEHGLAA